MAAGNGVRSLEAVGKPVNSSQREEGPGDVFGTGDGFVLDRCSLSAPVVVEHVFLGDRDDGVGGAVVDVGGRARLLANGDTMKVVVESPTDISSVRLVRNPSMTHLVDPDQRTVELAVVERSGNTLTLAVPDNAALPPGPYMLFANRHSERGEIPSVSRPVLVGPGNRG